MEKPHTIFNGLIVNVQPPPPSGGSLGEGQENPFQPDQDSPWILPPPNTLPLGGGVNVYD